MKVKINTSKYYVVEKIKTIIKVRLYFFHFNVYIFFFFLIARQFVIYLISQCQLSYKFWRLSTQKSYSDYLIGHRTPPKWPYPGSLLSSLCRSKRTDTYSREMPNLLVENRIRSQVEHPYQFIYFVSGELYADDIILDFPFMHLYCTLVHLYCTVM